MLQMKEQFDRFYTVLAAKGEFSIDCEKCPIKEQCFEYAETHCPETDENALCCEELLLSFILTGETPTPQGSFGLSAGRPWVSQPVFQQSQALPLFIYNLFTFPIFSTFSRNPNALRPGIRDTYAHMAQTKLTGRRRTTQAVFPTGPSICEFFPTPSGLLYAPIFSRNSPGRSVKRERRIWHLIILKVNPNKICHDFLPSIQK